MSDRPIIFSAPMVRALLDGRKTQTRRLIRGAPLEVFWHCDQHKDGWRFVVSPDAPSFPAQIRFAIGDRLWVKEAFFEERHKAERGPFSTFWFKATNAEAFMPDMTWWSPIFMPRVASRLTLNVTGVRPHRLREITVADARAEGFAPLPDGGDEWHAFLDYWNEMHGPGATDANPWVVALTFTVAKINIDALDGMAA